MQKPSSAASPEPPSRPAIFTIGHGTRSLPNLIDLLQPVGITKLVDIRSIPGSAKNPQFNRERLASSDELHAAQIEYIWLGDKLGGYRSGARQPNVRQHTAIRVAAFRNYAGYMCTPAFKEGLAELKSLAGKSQGSGRVAIMCSETLWWSCHRRMIADALVADSWEVRHLGVGKEAAKHEPWEISRKDESGNLIYDKGS